MTSQINYSFFILAGRLEDDWQLSYYGADNKPVAKNKIIVTSWNGQKPVDYAYSVTAFGSTAERLQRYTVRGSSILLDGNISASEYEYQGERKKSMSFIVRSFTLLKNMEDYNSQRSNEQQSSIPSEQPYSDNQSKSNDVPF